MRSFGVWGRVGLVLYLAAFVRPAAGQQARFDRLGVEDGLSQSTVTSIVQDRHGFLWVGTDTGLNRYDGYGFVVFAADAADSLALPNAAIHHLLVDRDGVLWIGSYGGGLIRRDPETGRFQSFRHDAADPSSLSNDRVLTILEDREGVLWIGMEAGGLNRFDPRAPEAGFRHGLDGPASLRSGTVRALAETSDGALWIATDDGLCRRPPSGDDVACLRHDPADPWSLSADVVDALYATRDGMLWVGTRASGLGLLDPAAPEQGVTRFRADAADPYSLSSDFVQFIREDHKGRLWITTEGGGLNRLDRATGRFHHYRHDAADPASVGSDRLRYLYEDRGGVLWVGSWDSGLSRLRESPFARYAHDPEDPHSLSPGSIGSFSEDRDGNLWIGTFSNGVDFFDRATGRFRHYRPEPGRPNRISHAVARAVLVDREGFVWIATRGAGLDRLDPRTGTFTSFRHDPGDPRSLGGSIVTSLYEDRSGTLWATTYEGGPCRLDREAGHFTCLGRPETGGAAGAVAPQAYTMLEARDGRLWFSDWGTGVDVLDPATGAVTRFRPRPAADSTLSHNNVLSFFEDRHGRVWMGTYGGGLNVYDPSTGRFTVYTTADGLPDNVVYGLLEDGRGRLWISTNAGLARLDPETFALDAFDESDGLQSNEFNGGSFLRLRSGEMVFGGPAGFNLFHPDSVRVSDYRPPVVLTAFDVFGKPLRTGRTLAALSALRLDHTQNFFSVEFAALDFSAPENIDYAYRLEGLEDEWVYSGHRRFASYTDLRPGAYVLRIKATNGAGVWHEDAFALPVTVVPPFWMTTWFRLGVVLLALGLVVGVVRYLSTRRLRRQVRELETQQRLQAERERISRDLHDHVGAQLSSIISGVELVRLSSERGGGDGLSAYLHALDDDARRTMAQLRETIWALHHQTVTLGDFRDQVQRFALARARYHPGLTVRCAVTSNPEAALSPVRALNLFRIGQEAINNAVKHAGATRLHVEVGHHDGRLVLTVEDDGTFNEPPDEGPPGDGLSGYGLDGMRRRAEEMNGTFTLRKNGGAGTTVVVSIPAEQARLPG